MNRQTPYQANILIVEDQLDNLRLLSNLLKDQGYQVRQAIDGEMALLAAETQPPDLMLLDINIPLVDGYQVCQQLKSKQNTVEIPIVFLSAFDEVGEKVKAFEMGGVDYLSKPYQLEEVLARVENQVKISLKNQQLKGNNSHLKQRLKLTEAANEFHNKPQIEAYLLHQAVAATHNGLIITDATDPTYPIMYVNPGFERMTGYSLVEVKGKNCRFLQGSDRNQPQLEQLRHSIHAGQPCCCTLRNYRKDGSLFWNEVSLSPIKDESGQVIYYIGVQTDITGRKQAEQEQQRYEASLHKMNRELHELNCQLYRLANLDGLTEVANRRCFDETLAQEWRRLSREKRPLSLILGDIDYFKRYNDTHGHLGGDNCLKKVAQVMTKAIYRPADLVARYGGEEFAIILPNTANEGAKQVAQRILEGIRCLKIPHETSEIQSYVTMSLGVATIIPRLDSDLKSLIDSADEALYQAKQQGRDRLVCAKVLSS